MARATATQQQPPVHVGTPIDDYGAIAATVQLYIDGSAHEAEQGFHPNAQMYGAIGDDRSDVPITDDIKLIEKSPGGPTMRGRITSIVQAGDAATATVDEDGFWGTMSFVTYLALPRIDAIRSLGVWPVDVAGLSTGGSIAQQLAADHPDVVGRLVLLCTACR